MFRKWRNKLLAGLAAVACSFGVLGVWAQNEFAMPAVGQAMAETAENENTSSVTQGVTPSPQGEGETQGEGEGAYSIEIVAKNLSYSDSLYILYAVSFEGFDESQNEVQMLFWDSLQTEYTVETAVSVRSAEYTTTLGEQECIVFYSDGIAAKEMNDLLYCRAYAEVDGEAVYSDVEKYSVVDYVYEKRAEGNLSANQTAVFADMLDYGASAQRLFDYNADKLANATYYTVTVENGVLEDGFAWGRYASNESVTLTANTPADGYIFSAWVDETNETVGTTETLSITLTADKTYTAVYMENPASVYEYTSDGSAVTITKYIGDYTEVEIPSTIDGLPVTKIGKSAFEDCSGLTSVVIPDSVTSIEDSAFYGCSGLTSVVISNKVTSIGDWAFGACSCLTSIEIPDGVTSIGNCAFYRCNSLTSIEIPDGVTSIGNYAFYYCSSLTSVEIGDGLASIGSEAFRDCSGLTSVVIPDSVTSIGDAAFYGCSSLTSIEIPDGVASIGDRAFFDCNSLMSMVIGDGVTRIVDWAFAHCSGLTSVVIPDGVTSIGNYAFAYCSSLTIYCEAESQPEGWSEDWNYSNCPVVWGYKAPTDVSAFEYTSDGSAVTITKYIGEDTEVIIPSTIDGLPVTKIGDSAFWDCSSLTSVVIPDSVTSIWSSAFTGCSSLTSVVIPDSVTSIGDYVFFVCSSLTSVVIGDSVTSIGGGAFEGCSSLTSVVIGDSVTSIGIGAFSGCSSLINITIGENNTAYKDIDGNIYTKDGTTLIQYAIGKTATEFTVPDGVTSIGEYAFAYCSGLTSVVIPNSVTSIEGHAFVACYGLTSIEIPDSVTSIGEYAFYQCRGLTSVMIPDSVTSIGERAFYQCSGLTSIVIPESVTSIGRYAFAWCEQLQVVEIPSSVEYVGSSAFDGCAYLTILCQASSQPSGWSSSWNSFGCTVLWGQPMSA